MSPNGGYDPVPIEEHDAAIIGERRAIATRMVEESIKSAAEISGMTFAEIVDRIRLNRELDRAQEAIRQRRLREEEAMTVRWPEPLE